MSISTKDKQHGSISMLPTNMQMQSSCVLSLFLCPLSGVRRGHIVTRATVAPARPAVSGPSAAIDTSRTPASLGFTMPGEFEKHAGCWMGWPYDKVGLSCCC